MPSKKESLPVPKLVSRPSSSSAPAAKSAEELEHEEYLRQLELAIENH